ncbi:phenylalanine--tRNA ligase subunit beta-related protein [Pontiella desulfatans]|uniref:phenylalanine--tRNA ligase subunit beta-related protein n=1 Tax=Pontiella desulfatans TaxID=2750659 RepID=UPI0038B358C8
MLWTCRTQGTPTPIPSAMPKRAFSTASKSRLRNKTPAAAGEDARGKRNLECFGLFDVYQGKGIEKENKSLAYTFVYRSEKRP